MVTDDDVIVVIKSVQDEKAIEIGRVINYEKQNIYMIVKLKLYINSCVYSFYYLNQI